jgi:hypothetical protein
MYLNTCISPYLKMFVSGIARHDAACFILRRTCMLVFSKTRKLVYMYS